MPGVVVGVVERREHIERVRVEDNQVACEIGDGDVVPVYRVLDAGDSPPMVLDPVEGVGRRESVMDDLSEAKAADAGRRQKCCQ